MFGLPRVSRAVSVHSNYRLVANALSSAILPLALRRDLRMFLRRSQLQALQVSPLKSRQISRLHGHLWFPPVNHQESHQINRQASPR